MFLPVLHSHISVKVNSKLQQSLEFLKLNRAQAKVFLASNYYMGAEAIGFAKDLGFVVIAPNGKNLEVYQVPSNQSFVLYPSLYSWLF
jgi:hypothetical protein